MRCEGFCDREPLNNKTSVFGVQWLLRNWLREPVIAAATSLIRIIECSAPHCIWLTLRSKNYTFSIHLFSYQTRIHCFISYKICKFLFPLLFIEMFRCSLVLFDCRYYNFPHIFHGISLSWKTKQRLSVDSVNHIPKYILQSFYDLYL